MDATITVDTSTMTGPDCSAHSKHPVTSLPNAAQWTGTFDGQRLKVMLQDQVLFEGSVK